MDQHELLEGVAGEPALEAHLQGLERHEPPARELEVGVRELGDPLVPGRRRGDEESRQRAADPQLVARQVPAVVAEQAERVAGDHRHRAVAQRHGEGRAFLEDHRVGEVDGRRRGRGDRGGGQGLGRHRCGRSAHRRERRNADMP